MGNCQSPLFGDYRISQPKTVAAHKQKPTDDIFSNIKPNSS